MQPIRPSFEVSTAKPTLIDKTNVKIMLPYILGLIMSGSLIGIDIETDNRNAHPGLLKLEEKKVTFDVNRQIMTGFSVYVDGTDRAFYFNLNHADEENRLSFYQDDIYKVIQSKPSNAWWIAHNAPFEICMFQAIYQCSLGNNIICSMQLCVTAFNRDTYPLDSIYNNDIGDMKKLMPQVVKLFAGQANDYGVELSKEQEELLSKFIAKESDSSHSYNGYVKSLSYGFDLKKVTKSIFRYEMVTYDQVVGNGRMGDKTGPEIVSYGCDDAYWCVQVYKAVLEWLMIENPAVIRTFFEQENPMIHVYAELWHTGLKVNYKNIIKRRDVERKNAAIVLRDMKQAVRDLLPFDPEPHEKLVKYDEWFVKNWEKYRGNIIRWAESPDCESDYEQLQQVRSPVSNAWAAELGKPESNGPNLIHYMTMRTMLYDLAHLSFQLKHGKTQSDGDTRDEMMRRHAKVWAETRGLTEKDVINDKFEILNDELKTDPKIRLLQAFKKMAGIDQRMKLFVTPYIFLTDPDTGRMYPILSCLLNSRRTSCSQPNGQQLSKFGESAYVRGFFEADDDEGFKIWMNRYFPQLYSEYSHENLDEQLIVSADLSAVELVIIGEYSGDEEFYKAYGSLPHKDMHSPAAARMLEISVPELKARPDYKQMRTDLGKGSNFNYWYSGALGTVAEKQGWSSDKMWAAVDLYRSMFPQGEQWRVETINGARMRGYVQLPDHTRRYRFESTYQWADLMRNKFANYNVPLFTEKFIRKIQTRSGNQSVNSLVQGLCATLVKRKILKMRKIIKEKGYLARFWLLVHDELVFSVHRKHILPFLKDLYTVMIDGEGLINNLKLDSSLAIGRTFQPFDPKEAPYGQVELMEINKKLSCIPPERWEQRATDEEILTIVDYMFKPITEAA